MNSDLLRTFIEVSKTRHFGKAAENLCLTQSAVSFRIKQLEENVGSRLFIRERNNILLTSTGERLLPHAENILNAWQSALQDVGAAANQDLQITLASTSNLWDTFLQSLLPKAVDTLKGLNIRTEVDSHQNLTRALLGGRVDIAVLLDPPQVAELSLSKIGDIELVLVADQADLTLAQLSDTRHIFVDWGTSVNVLQTRSLELLSSPILHTGQTHIALEFLMTHGGIALLPRALVAPYIENNTLYLVGETETLKREVYAVSHEQSSKQHTLNAVIKLLKHEDLKPAALLVN